MTGLTGAADPARTDDIAVVCPRCRFCAEPLGSLGDAKQHFATEHDGRAFDPRRYAHVEEMAPDCALPWVQSEHT